MQGFSVVFICVFHSATLVNGITPGGTTKPNGKTEKTPQQQFEQFIVEYEKTYATPAEKTKRFGIFQESLKKIEQLMANRKGNVVFGITEMADLTEEEFMKSYTRLEMPGNMKNVKTKVDSNVKSNAKPNASPKRRRSPMEGGSSGGSGGAYYFGDRSNYPRAASMWIGNRGCSACWAFATATAIEILHEHLHGTLTILSKQQLIDCVPNNGGCHGNGQIYRALPYAHQTGLTTETAYPYKAKDQFCKSDIQPVVKCGGFRLLNNDAYFTEALATSPVPCGFHVGPSFQHYRGGVFDPSDCLDDPASFNHAAVIVGYTSEAWIILNSWGSRWGDEGYVWLKKGNCGVGKHGFQLQTTTAV